MVLRIERLFCCSAKVLSSLEEIIYSLVMCSLVTFSSRSLVFTDSTGKFYMLFLSLGETIPEHTRMLSQTLNISFKTKVKSTVEKEVFWRDYQKRVAKFSFPPWIFEMVGPISARAHKLISLGVFQYRKIISMFYSCRICFDLTRLKKRSAKNDVSLKVNSSILWNI